NTTLGASSAACTESGSTNPARQQTIARKDMIFLKHSFITLWGPQKARTLSSFLCIYCPSQIISPSQPHGAPSMLPGVLSTEILSKLVDVKASSPISGTLLGILNSPCRPVHP